MDSGSRSTRPEWPSAEWSLFAQLDQARRWQGQLFDAVGLGPIQTPSRVVLSQPAFTLKTYGDADRAGPVLLIVPAPIKRAYIWDLEPRLSVVQQCLRGGLRVYLIQWEHPGVVEQGLGLAEYADRFILDCLETVEAETGEAQAFLAGHSLGGTLAAIFAALHPGRLRGLTLLGAPLRFAEGAGDFAPLVSVAPPAQLVTALLGNVPGSFLNMVSVMASPMTFQGERWMDWLGSLPDAEAMQSHLRVERWTLDEMPLPRQLFEEVVELLYREDRLMRGTLMVGGRRAAPEQIDVPLLNVADARCRIIPPESVLPFHHAVRSAEKRVLWYSGDVGVALQHVGMLVGRTAHRTLWPEILQWLHAHSPAG